ncbi:hypothetical protein B0T16DRAFT_436233 [Cercophora newfieldiana]|uniref:FAD-binding PCMH-type domain-containing protein n=1 Tax=Cercophora newfieldiana TaxID=92897 RepID=A0AA39YAY5_9PEZI|nr:hypothetical protein B0T16DRAFT_436233 [Cercophora newfieldiana]
MGIDVAPHFGLNDSERIQTELGPLLSEKASILLPSSLGWDQSRSSSPRIEPKFIAIVEVATEEDVQETVKYANRLTIPFLAISGSHGWATTLNNFQGGIQINMRKLNTAEAHADGKTATVGGGMMQYEITESLYRQGKKLAVTGLCGLPHGFAADSLVSARLVLANSSIVTVSATENSDLFWAVRGAGQNFGIVTSFEVKIHDASEDWTMDNNLESQHKKIGMLVMAGLVFRNPELDPEHPVVALQIMSPASNPFAAAYNAAFQKLSPVFHTTVNDIPYEKLFATSAYILESYGRDGVEAVPEGENVAVRATGVEYGERIREATRANEHAYLNYAVGGEGLENVYGERLERLRALKKVWDPENRFGFYIPIR